MSLPLFFTREFPSGLTDLYLDPETSKHISQVLRMREGEWLQLTDGRGKTARAIIEWADRRSCKVLVREIETAGRPAPEITLAVSMLKNTGRFEWLLEKTTELGVRDIVPLICERTERQRFRPERFNGILQTALLQSQQSWLPELKEPTPLKDFLGGGGGPGHFIAHCAEGVKKELINVLREGKDNSRSPRVILIGPEGDFSGAEIEMACNCGYIPVSLGKNRLRTETAAMAAVALLRLWPMAEDGT